MFRTIIQYLALVCFLFSGLQSKSVTFSHDFSGDKNWDSISSVHFENAASSEQNHFIVQPFSSSLHGIIGIEGPYVEEDEDESISHKKYLVKNEQSTSPCFVSSLCYSENFLKKHYYSYLHQFQSSSSCLFRLLEVFRL